MDAKILSFPELVKEVGEWSQYNFGDQDGLNEAAPLLGVVEEIMYELRAARTTEDRRDAFADSFIFLADVFYRAGLYTSTVSWTDRESGSLTQALGLASQKVLKFRQSIRDVDKRNVESSLISLFRTMVSRYYDILGTYTAVEALVSTTWAEVKKRDWKKSPVDAHKVATELDQ